MVGPGAACDGEGAGSAGFESLLGACCFIILSHQDFCEAWGGQDNHGGEEGKKDKFAHKPQSGLCEQMVVAFDAKNP